MGRTVRWEGFTAPSCEKLQEQAAGERRLWSGNAKSAVVLQTGSCGVGWAQESPHLQSGGGRKRIDLNYVLFLFIFPAHVALPYPSLQKLFNNRAYNTSLKYLLSGPGVDEPPEVGLFSMEDDADGHVYVHRTIDRERTPAFQVTHLHRSLPAQVHCYLMAKRFTGMRHACNNVKCVF